ncbi:hypothetical protein CNR22_15395 [Sphingobacteriaceae bacterium]|nr:hypothetical protein CNR22_15395 [Sphingobacteriaceae bacterium]
MTTQYGKYKVFEDDKSFEIHYRHSLSDIFGSVIFVLSFATGLMLFYTSYKTFNATAITSWVLLIVGSVFSVFGAYALLAGLYSPGRGVFQIDKTTNDIIIRDFLKSESIKTTMVKSVSYELKENGKPKSIYSMLYLRLSDGKKKDCFIIRSSIPLDIGREVDKDIHVVSRQLKGAIMNVIKNQRTSSTNG